MNLHFKKSANQFVKRKKGLKSMLADRNAKIPETTLILAVVIGMFVVLLAASSVLLVCCIRRRQDKPESQESSATQKPNEEWLAFSKRPEKVAVEGEVKPLRNLSEESDLSRSMVVTRSISDDAITARGQPNSI
uniref:Uncharacterized protein n=1 Tax=Panagrolaimus sp. JU765 TaxID=591449 RepID=A0AC34RJ90_9BILA